MDSMLDAYRERLKTIIIETCNKIGCNNCGLSWGKDCSATELQGKILEIEMKPTTERQDG